MAIDRWGLICAELNRPGFSGDTIMREDGVMEEQGSLRAAIVSIASKTGCTPETLRRWVRQQEKDSGKREGLATDDKTRIKEWERENRFFFNELKGEYKKLPN